MSPAERMGALAENRGDVAAAEPETRFDLRHGLTLCVAAFTDWPPDDFHRTFHVEVKDGKFIISEDPEPAAEEFPPPD